MRTVSDITILYSAALLDPAVSAYYSLAFYYRPGPDVSTGANTNSRIYLGLIEIKKLDAFFGKSQIDAAPFQRFFLVVFLRFAFIHHFPAPNKPAGLFPVSLRRPHKYPLLP